MNKYVCVLSTNSYIDGLLVLNENLKQLKSKYSLLCLINETISESVIKKIKDNDIEYKKMPKLKSEYLDSYNPQWFHSFDKINIFNLTEYEKIVYLDLDLLILNNIDKLFNKKNLSMAIDYPFSDEFNTGVMVIKPNKQDYENMIELLKNNPTKYKGDQTLINEYFKDKINTISMSYNSLRAIFYNEMDFFDYVRNQKMIKNAVYVFNEQKNPNIIHYIGPIKPFTISGNFFDKYSDKYMEILKRIKR